FGGNPSLMMWSAKATRKFPAHRQAQASLQLGKEARAAAAGFRYRADAGVAGAGPRLEHFDDFLDQPGEAGFVRAQHLDLFAGAAYLAGDAFEFTPVCTAFLEQGLAVSAAARFERRELPRLVVIARRQSRELDQAGAVGLDHARRVLRDVGEVMELARRVGEILARERQAHEVGHAARTATCAAGQRARGEQPAEPFLLRFDRAFLRASAQAQLADRGARLARLRLELLQRAVGIGNRDFGSA